MKKIIVSLLILAAMLVNILAMTGCNLGKNKGDDGFEEGKINIRFYHTMGQNLSTVLDYYVEEFETLYPDINVIHEQVGGYDDVRDQISTELTTGAQPNIAYCYPDHVALYNVAKAVRPLDDFIDSKETYTLSDGTETIVGLTDEQKADFIEGYYNEGKAFGDGKMYTMPLSKSTEVLYYNMDFFAKHNLEVPTTWEEMEAVCARIMEIDPASTPLGYDSEANWFITMTEQLGTPYTSATGEKFLFDDDRNHEFVKTFREWYVKGYLTTQEIYGSYTSGLFTSTGENKSYMSIGSSAGATKQCTDGLSFKVGIAPVPQADPENPKVISQGPSVCIFEDQDAEKEKASWLFVKFLTTSVGFQAEFSEASGYMPVIKSVTEDAEYQAFLNSANNTNSGIAALSVKMGLEMADAYYVSPAFNGSSKARDEVGALLQACLLIDPKLSDAQVDAEIDKLFDDAIANCKYSAG